MSYQDKCIAAFKVYVNEQDWDKATKELATQVFQSGFEFGSINGAADSIQQYAIKNMKPIKNIKAREIIDKFGLSRSD